MFKTCLYITSLIFSYGCLILLISVGIFLICLKPRNDMDFLIGIMFIILFFFSLFVIYNLRSYYCPCCYPKRENNEDNIETQTQQIMTDINPIPPPSNISSEIGFNDKPTINPYEENEITVSYV